MQSCTTCPQALLSTWGSWYTRRKLRRDAGSTPPLMSSFSRIATGTCTWPSIVARTCSTQTVCTGIEDQDTAAFQDVPVHRCFYLAEAQLPMLQCPPGQRCTAAATADGLVTRQADSVGTAHGMQLACDVCKTEEILTSLYSQSSDPGTTKASSTLIMSSMSAGSTESGCRCYACLRALGARIALLSTSSVPCRRILACARQYTTRSAIKLRPHSVYTGGLCVSHGQCSPRLQPQKSTFSGCCLLRQRGQEPSCSCSGGDSGW